MQEAFWMQLGANPTFALAVDGEIVGSTFWVDEELIPRDGSGYPVLETGWYWVAMGRPRRLHRVAQGLELMDGSSEGEQFQTVEKVLDVVASEVLAEGGGESEKPEFGSISRAR
jgi:hypothetical protein